ncbi:MAG: hypothetical protein WCJ45_01545 [bacterium]
MNTTIQIPTIVETVKDQLVTDINILREIMSSVKNDLKEEMLKLYGGGPGWYNAAAREGNYGCDYKCTGCVNYTICHSESKKDSELKPEKEEPEEDKEIIKLQQDIQKLKEKKEMKEKLAKKERELIDQEEVLQKNKDEIAKIQRMLNSPEDTPIS